MLVFFTSRSHRIRVDLGKERRRSREPDGHISVADADHLGDLRNEGGRDPDRAQYGSYRGEERTAHVLDVAHHGGGDVSVDGDVSGDSADRIKNIPRIRDDGWDDSRKAGEEAVGAGDPVGGQPDPFDGEVDLEVVGTVQDQRRVFYPGEELDLKLVPRENGEDRILLPREKAGTWKDSVGGGSVLGVVVHDHGVGTHPSLGVIVGGLFARDYDLEPIHAGEVKADADVWEFQVPPSDGDGEDSPCGPILPKEDQGCLRSRRIDPDGFQAVAWLREVLGQPVKADLKGEGEGLELLRHPGGGVALVAGHVVIHGRPGRAA